MNELIAHIQNLNAQTIAWVNEDPANRWAGTLKDEPEYWAKYGITTVAEFDHYMAATELYEAYKYKYGFHPDYSRIKTMTIEQIREELKNL
jgi:hypothetical protein